MMSWIWWAANRVAGLYSLGGEAAIKVIIFVATSCREREWELKERLMGDK